MKQCRNVFLHTPAQNVDYHDDANTPGKGGSKQRLTCNKLRPLDCVMQSSPDGFNSFRSTHCWNRGLGSVVAIFAPSLPKRFLTLGIMSLLGVSAPLAGTSVAAMGLQQRGRTGAINPQGAFLGSSSCARGAIRRNGLERSFARGRV